MRQLTGNWPKTVKPLMSFLAVTLNHIPFWTVNWGKHYFLLYCFYTLPSTKDHSLDWNIQVFLQCNKLKAVPLFHLSQILLCIFIIKFLVKRGMQKKQRGNLLV